MRTQNKQSTWKPPKYTYIMWKVEKTYRSMDISFEEIENFRLDHFKSSFKVDGRGNIMEVF